MAPAYSRIAVASTKRDSLLAGHVDYFMGAHMKTSLHRVTPPVPTPRTRRRGGRTAGIFLVLAALAGCGSMSSTLSQSKSTLYDRDGVDLVLDHTTGFATIFKEENSTERSCRAVGPDFVTGQGDSVSISAAGGTGISGGKSFDAAVAGGRSPGLLALREILYRACELSLNLNADKQLTLEIYKHFLGKAIDASKALAQSQGSAGETLNGSAPAINSNSDAPSSTDANGSIDSSSAYGSGDQTSGSYGSDPDSGGGSTSTGNTSDDTNSTSDSAGSGGQAGDSVGSTDYASGSSGAVDGSSGTSSAGTPAAQ